MYYPLKSNSLPGYTKLKLYMKTVDAMLWGDTVRFPTLHGLHALTIQQCLDFDRLIMNIRGRMSYSS